MTERNLDHLLDAWLDLGPIVAPARVAEAARLEIATTQQTAGLRGWPPRRFPVMNSAVRYALVAAVVAVAAVIGYSYLVTPNIGDDRPIDDRSSAEPSAERVGAPLNEQEGPLAAGNAYSLEVENVRITLIAPARWVKNVIDNMVWHTDSVVSVSFGTVENLVADPCAASAGEMDPPVGPTIADLVRGLESMSALEVAVSDVTVGGYEGALVELTAADPVDGCLRGDDGGLWLLPSGESVGAPAPFGRSELWLVDVEGTRLVINAEVRSAASTEVQAQVRDIVDNLRIEPIR